MGENMLEIYGELPKKENISEFNQYKRVVSILRKILQKTNYTGIIVSETLYSHRQGKLIDNDCNWNGQFDLILILSHKIIIYELKAKEITINFGTTDNRDWEWYYNSDLNKKFKDSFFKQISKQRIYFLSEFLNKFKEKYSIPAPHHFVIDSRVILKNGSDYSRFFYKPPANYDMEKFKDNILNKISKSEDKEFMLSVYSKKSDKEGFNKQRYLKKSEYTKLCNIIEKNQIKLKTANWFKILTEDKIEKDFFNIPDSDKFNISYENIRKIPYDLGLKKIDF